MSERDLDSSSINYEEEVKDSNYVKQLQWDMAIGLQEVDNLKPSKYLEKLVNDNVDGNLTIDDVKKELREYYIEKENKNEIDHNEWNATLYRQELLNYCKKIILNYQLII